MQDIAIEDISPLKKTVIIKPLERGKETDEGLSLPDQEHAGAPVVGEVLKAGAESQFLPGDIVFFRRYSVDELTFPVNGEKKTISFVTDNEIIGFTRKA